jgi:hypothetical protein
MPQAPRSAMAGQAPLQPHPQQNVERTVQENDGPDATGGPFHNTDWANSWTMGALNTIATNSVENWPSLLHTTAEIEIDKAAKLILELRYFLLLCYFTDRPPRLPTFQDWVHTEMSYGRGWPIKQVKFTGKSFFLIVFEEAHHRDAAHDCNPWFMDGRFVYTFEWTPEFDVRTESYMQLPVWIELPFCTLILERSRQLIAESL